MPRNQLFRFLSSCLDLIFPIECLGCGKEGAWLCTDCARTLPPAPERCPFCPTETKRSVTCPDCEVTHALNGLTARTLYRHELTERLTHGLKYRFWSSIGPTLGSLMAEALLESHHAVNTKHTVIIPIPLHKSRERMRGFNQSNLLSRQVAALLNIPISNSLQRIKATKSQATLHETDRFLNIRRAFALCKNVDLSGKSVILVDDVSTTGATLDAAAAACKNNGADKIWGLVLARGVLKNPRRVGLPYGGGHVNNTERRVGPLTGDLPKGDRGLLIR